MLPHVFNMQCVCMHWLSLNWQSKPVLAQKTEIKLWDAESQCMRARWWWQLLHIIAVVYEVSQKHITVFVSFSSCFTSFHSMSLMADAPIRYAHMHTEYGDERNRKEYVEGREKERKREYLHFRIRIIMYAISRMWNFIPLSNMDEQMST